MSLVFVASLLSLFLSLARADVNELGQETYDIDSSWAIKSKTLSTTFGNKQALYDDFMHKCLEATNGDEEIECNDDLRLAINSDQPMGMRNYTDMGFKKVKAPERVSSLLREFWEQNHESQSEETGSFGVYHNKWDSSPTFVSIYDESFVGGGQELANEVTDAVRKMLEEWTGQHLFLTDIYGIRVYHNDSILTPHVDRNPLVTSAIINVAQDVDEPWPLEVWGHDGKPYNITMEPADMVLYESHSVIHGRPFPFRGNYFANVFVHFEVIGSKSETGEIYLDEEARKSREAGLPPYVIAGSAWADEWHKEHPNGWDLPLPVDVQLESYNGHLEKLRVVAAVNRTKLHERDFNGWQPIHEAARQGHVDVVKFLLENGADVNATTTEGNSYSPLKLAVDYLGKDHPVSSLLRTAGGHAMYAGKDEL